MWDERLYNSIPDNSPDRQSVALGLAGYGGGLCNQLGPFFILGGLAATAIPFQTLQE